MGQICKFCIKEFFFKNKVSMGGHTASCNMNPNSKLAREKRNKTRTKELSILQLNCLKCGVTFEQTAKPHIIRNNKHKKYCSTKCSHSRIATEKSKNAAREFLIKLNKKKSEEFRKKLPKLFCQNPSCQAEFFSQHWKQAKYCTSKCAAYKSGGQRLYSGRSRYHGGWYKDIWMDSSWELALAKRLDELNIEWIRDNTKYFEYIDMQGRIKKYYPDFYIPSKDLYIEVKGYWTDKIKHKMSEVTKNYPIKLEILESLDVINKFNV